MHSLSQKKWITLLMLLVFNYISNSQTTYNDPAFISKVLEIHNNYRSQVGSPPLQWSPALALSAYKWASHLSQTGKFTHDPNFQEGENLAGGSGNINFQQLIGLWAAEKNNFINRPYPNCSKTGKDSDVGHYTQIVWKRTREVGCALVSGKRTCLVCRYNPAGNFIGEKTY
jgi:uncharacterized protein YkwD